MPYGVIVPSEHPSRPTFLDSMTNQHQQILPINCRAKYLEIGILRLRDLTQLLKDLADLLDNVVDLRLALEDDCLRPDSTQTSALSTARRSALSLDRASTLLEADSAASACATPSGSIGLSDAGQLEGSAASSNITTTEILGEEYQGLTKMPWCWL
jgi:hypothetical protein